MKIFNMHFVKHEHYKGKMEYLRQKHLVFLYFKILPDFVYIQYSKYLQEKIEKPTNQGFVNNNKTTYGKDSQRNGSHLKEMWI